MRKVKENLKGKLHDFSTYWDEMVNYRAEGEPFSYKLIRGVLRNIKYWLPIATCALGFTISDIRHDIKQNREFNTPSVNSNNSYLEGIGDGEELALHRNFFKGYVTGIIETLDYLAKGGSFEEEMPKIYDDELIGI